MVYFFEELSVPFLLLSPPRKIWKWFQIEIINISLELCSLVFGTFCLFLTEGSCLFNLHHYSRNWWCETSALP